MNTQRSAYTGWMTLRDRQLFHVLLDGMPPKTRAEVVDALVRSERERSPSLEPDRDEEASAEDRRPTAAWHLSP